MAVPEIIKFSEFLIQLGDGASPEVFTEPCVFVSKGFNQSASTVEDPIPDCDDPDAASETYVSVDSLKRELTGSGKLGALALSVWQDWFDSAQTINVKVKITKTSALGGGSWKGPAVLTQFNIKGDRKKALDFDASIMFFGKPVWTAAIP